MAARMQGFSAAPVALKAACVNTIGLELRELAEDFPERTDTTVSGGLQERALARTVLKELVLGLRRVDMAAAAGHFDAAADEFANFRKLMASAVPMVLTNAVPWSLFSPAIHDAHYAALRQMLQAANGARH
jgi:hypothetical protein